MITFTSFSDWQWLCLYLFYLKCYQWSIFIHWITVPCSASEARAKKLKSIIPHNFHNILRKISVCPNWWTILVSNSEKAFFFQWWRYIYMNINSFINSILKSKLSIISYLWLKMWLHLLIGFKVEGGSFLILKWLMYQNFEWR